MFLLCIKFDVDMLYFLVYITYETVYEACPGAVYLTSAQLFHYAIKMKIFTGRVID